MNGVWGASYTQGVQQGEDSRFLKTIVTLKHWDACVRVLLRCRSPRAAP